MDGERVGTTNGTTDAAGVVGAAGTAGAPGLVRTAGPDNPTTPTAPTAPRVLHRAELRGRATGVGVMACFALGWSAGGVGSLPVTAGRAVFAGCAVLTVVFAVLAARMTRRAAGAPEDTDLTPAVKRAAGRRFLLVLGAEIVAIFVIARVLGATGHSEAVPAVIALAVGLHFFPLAGLFGVRFYHLTGAALCLFAVAALLLAPLTSTPALWTLLPGLGSALTLYATAARLVQPRP
ncbi:hypothetical protein [Streptomyces liangshanensis]|uniref:Uncharacterized protein n=1 Tax=Streptomyces liangshanensis TaxID=2717324 RepID=A0A6G9H0Z9_9ACTN|nr:hypothetical protein [Streptomyces liangshanensis]QIQ04185.1 hypothetical protein HA039_19390 [Streptomyces liangshanensis]